MEFVFVTQVGGVHSLAFALLKDNNKGKTHESKYTRISSPKLQRGRKGKERLMESLLVE